MEGMKLMNIMKKKKNRSLSNNLHLEKNRIKKKIAYM